MTAFLADGLAAGEPALVALPGPGLEQIKDGMGRSGDTLTFADMAEFGGNPLRIIPAVRAFTDAHPGRTRLVAEPIWPGRPAAEVREAIRHEALVNEAFSAVPITIMCAYDATGLDQRVLDTVGRTHARILRHGHSEPSRGFAAAAVARAIAAEPPDRPPAWAQAIEFGKGDLRTVRGHVERFASRAGLSRDQVRCFALAAHEITANTVRHATGHGTVYSWKSRDEVVCEVRDGGHITDPLAGRYLPSMGSESGQGLWLVSQLCDLVEMRSGAWGTSIRLHMRRRAAAG